MTSQPQTIAQVYAIDLGTTYSCIAYVNDVGQPQVIPGDNQSFVTPSVVTFIDSDQVLVGTQAKEEAKIFPDMTVIRIKDHMGELNADETPWTINVAGKERLPEEISAIILKKVASNVPNQLEGEIASSVVITIPAYFDSAQRRATEQAAELAGFDVKGLVVEPAAAALAYSIEHTQDQTVLVYDLGGGTFDTTVINIKNLDVTVVCTDGSRELGGWLWDERIKNFMRASWQEETGSPGDPLQDKATDLTWSERAETAKRQLTQRDTTDIRFNFDNGPLVTVNLTRETFDQLTSDLLEETLVSTANALKKASEKGFNDIDRFLLVGGSSYMKQVKESVEERFGSPAELFRPDLAVVLGAAKYANDAMLREAWVTTLEEAGKVYEELDDEEIKELEDQTLQRLPTGTVLPTGGIGSIPLGSSRENRTAR